MSIHFLVLGSNPFFDSYTQSDLMGKLIFIGLFILSITTWVLLIHKIWLLQNARKLSSQFYTAFLPTKLNPLTVDHSPWKESACNPFLRIYQVVKKHTVELLNKNRRFAKSSGGTNLSPADLDFVEAHLMSTVSRETQYLEKNLFILSTIVTLAPFLGLLGTVWGILTTFSELQTAGNSSQMVLGGLSMALATTVVGLIDAIPALIGYNYLKNEVHAFQTDMEVFSTEVLACVELHYRKVDVDS